MDDDFRRIKHAEPYLCTEESFVQLPETNCVPRYSSYGLGARNERRRELLQELIDWRNAITHQDFDPVVPGGITTLHLAGVRAWRSVVNALARHFDQIMYNYLRTLLGSAPW
jgi:hypothetical protein